ncbi:MAG: aminotransferase class I/II-fold pyridoxal phosphate-dependent enzyme [Balneolaceae bacterium]|nr:aminotransferase class I/II-fold pyridoxal phosphate-dependent enzyme [Balneolaceae bacterium]
MNLDVSSQQFHQWLEQAGKLIEEYYNQKKEQKVFAGKSPEEVMALFEEPLPERGMQMEDLLDKVRDDVLGSITNSAGPRYYGYITGGGNQAAVLAEMIKASLNQNNLKWHSSPVSTEMERLVMRWVAEFIGYPTGSAGVLLSGGSVANHNCLAVARTIKAPVNVAEEGLYNCPLLTVYVSEEGHSSFDKGVDMLGIGKKYLRKIPTNDDLQMDTEALEKKILEDKDAGFYPICAIGVAGTTNNGALDDLKAVSRICKKYDLWFHVDAAYGGPAAAVPKVSSYFDGIKEADSVVINPHKWMYVPFEAGGVLVKNPEHLRQTFSTIPDYLKSDKEDRTRTDLMEYNLPLTKEFKSLKVWMTLKTYGAAKIRETIEADIDKATYLVRKVKGHSNFEMVAPAPLSIVCFRYNPGGLDNSALDSLNDSIVERIESDGRVFLTGTKIKGISALRVCFINHRTTNEDIDFLVKTVAEIGQKAYREANI